jgi:hypothetical protein
MVPLIIIMVGILSLIVILIIALYMMYKNLPTKIRMSALGYQSGNMKKLRKVEGALNKDIQEMILNRDPAILNRFPHAMEVVDGNPNLAMPLASTLTRYMGSLLIDVIGQSIGAPAVATQTAKSVGTSPEVVQVVSNLIRSFIPTGNQSGQQKQKQLGEGGVI